jgi:hypothetical protein
LCVRVAMPVVIPDRLVLAAREFVLEPPGLSIFREIEQRPASNCAASGLGGPSGSSTASWRPASCPRVGVQIHSVKGRLTRSAHLIAKFDCQESRSTCQPIARIAIRITMESTEGGTGLGGRCSSSHLSSPRTVPRPAGLRLLAGATIGSPFEDPLADTPTRT